MRSIFKLDYTLVSKDDPLWLKIRAHPLVLEIRRVIGKKRDSILYKSGPKLWRRFWRTLIMTRIFLKLFYYKNTFGYIKNFLLFWSYHWERYRRIIK